MKQSDSFYQDCELAEFRRFRNAIYRGFKLTELEVLQGVPKSDTDVLYILAHRLYQISQRASAYHNRLLWQATKHAIQKERK